MNSIHITGRLTSDPELCTLPDGTKACAIRLAVKEMGHRREVGYVNATEYGTAGEAAARELSKGWLVAVSGCLKYRQWDTAAAGRRHDYEVVGHIEFLAAPREWETRSQELDQEPAVAA